MPASFTRALFRLHQACCDQARACIAQERFTDTGPAIPALPPNSGLLWSTTPPVYAGSGDVPCWADTVARTVGMTMALTEDSTFFDDQIAAPIRALGIFPGDRDDALLEGGTLHTFLAEWPEYCVRAGAAPALACAALDGGVAWEIVFAEINMRLTRYLGREAALAACLFFYRINQAAGRVAESAATGPRGQAQPELFNWNSRWSNAPAHMHMLCSFVADRGGLHDLAIPGVHIIPGAAYARMDGILSWDGQPACPLFLAAPSAAPEGARLLTMRSIRCPRGPRSRKCEASMADEFFV